MTPSPASVMLLTPLTHTGYLATGHLALTECTAMYSRAREKRFPPTFNRTESLERYIAQIQRLLQGRKD